VCETSAFWQNLFQEGAKDASVSECTGTLSALEALGNALYINLRLTYLPRRSLLISRLRRSSGRLFQTRGPTDITSHAL